MAGLSWYRAGTVAVTNGSKAVVGTDTLWAGVINPGDAVQAPDGKWYEVEAVSSNTALTLKTAYMGVTASAQAYAIMRVVPTGNVAAELAASLTGLVQRYNLTIDNLMDWLSATGSIQFTDGTTTLTVEALGRLIAAASETLAGRVELATAAETAAGSDSTRAVHPAGLKPLMDAKAPLASPVFSGVATINGGGSTYPLVLDAASARGGLIAKCSATSGTDNQVAALLFDYDGAAISQHAMFVAYDASHATQPNVVDIKNFRAGAMRFLTNNVERFRVWGDGGASFSKPAETYSLASSSGNSGVYTPAGTSVAINSSGSSGGIGGALLNFTAMNAAAGASGAFLGAVADVTNGPAHMVFGRRTGVTSWAEVARFHSSGRLLVGTTSDNGVDLGQVNGSLSANVLRTASYTKATVPAASAYPRGIIYVSDAAGGAAMAWSNGTSWISKLTNAAI